MALVATQVLMHAQPPSLVFNGTSGRLFAVDDQTNLHVNAYGPVVRLSATGTPLQTNTICPLYSKAARDAVGNYFFADVFSPPQDFGGVTLTDHHAFIARYDSAGTLMWAKTVGPVFVQGMGVTDLAVSSDGIAYVGYTVTLSAVSRYSALERFDGMGSNTWTSQKSTTIPGGVSAEVRFGPVTATNGFVQFFRYNSGNSAWAVDLERFDGIGARFGITSWIQPYTGNPVNNCARPVQNALGELFNVEGDQVVKRSGAGAVIWSRAAGNSISWTIGEDPFGGVYVSDQSASLRRYDFDGNLLWSLNTSAPVDRMINHGQSGRFISVNTGSSGRLTSDPSTLAPRLGGFLTSEAGPTFIIMGDAPAYRILATTNLTAWPEIGVVTNSGGSARFTDSDGTIASPRFYRAQTLP